MNQVVCDVATLVNALHQRKPLRVGIDGVDGVGKSEISHFVASTIGVPIIGLDDYVEKNKGGYVAYIDYASVATKIAATSGFVIEGVCLLEVLQRLDTSLDCLIYVKRMSSGFWSDEDDCEFPSGVEEAIRQSRRNIELLLEFEANQEGRPYAPRAADETGLSEEIMRYHDKYSPHSVADIVFCKDVG